MDTVADKLIYKMDKARLMLESAIEIGCEIELIAAIQEQVTELEVRYNFYLLEETG